MRVLIDYRSALRERTGVGEYTHQLACTLLKPRATGRTANDIDLTLFTSSWKDRLAPSPDLEGATIVDRRLPVRLLNLAWHRLEWPSIETLTRQTFDVAHSLHPLLLPSRHAARIVTVHDLNFLLHPERTRAEIRRDYPALAADHARRADRVIVVSKFTASEVTHHLGVSPDRISVCYPGAPPWSPRTEQPANGYVLFFGTLEPRKNLGVLLDAYERLIARGARVPPLRLAGKATGQSGPWLERIARAPLSGHVTHVGYVDPAKRRALYDGAVLLVQPSFEEGFGLPVLESMTAGLPVVAANRGALPEVLGGAGSLFEPDDADALAEAIEQLTSDRAAAAAAVERGLARSRQFTWSETARQTVAAYRAAIEAHNVRRGAA